MKCPNCHEDARGFYSTPNVGGEGVRHCGCYYEGDASGKEFHWSTECGYVRRAMLEDA